VRIEVEDRGLGIPEEFRARGLLISSLRRISSTSRHFEGTGLGLSITRQLVEAMGGTIGFSTITGQGTTFYFELPRADQALQAPQFPALIDTARYGCGLCEQSASTRGRQRGFPEYLHVEDDKDLGNVIKAALAGRAEVVNRLDLTGGRELLCEERLQCWSRIWACRTAHGLSLLELPDTRRPSDARRHSFHDRSLACRTAAGLRRARQIARVGGAHRADNSLAPASVAILRMPCSLGADSRTPPRFDFLGEPLGALH